MLKSRGLTTLLATLLLLTPGLCFAGQLQKEIDLTRSVVQDQRKGIVAASLPLSAEQQQAFWPLYDQYQAEMDDINDRTVKLLKEYSKHQDNMSDRRAGRLLDEYFSIEQAKLALRVLYRGKLAAVLPDKKVARFFQIENKMDAMLETELARGVPLVK
ncbi:MAG: hypothetical protein GY719_01520 [bacterium]|nr:hypothetical protein [bacterium]